MRNRVLAWSISIDNKRIHVLKKSSGPCLSWIIMLMQTNISKIFLYLNVVKYTKKTYAVTFMNCSKLVTTFISLII